MLNQKLSGLHLVVNHLNLLLAS